MLNSSVLFNTHKVNKKAVALLCRGILIHQLQGLNSPRAQTTQRPAAAKQASCSHTKMPSDQSATATLAAGLASAFQVRPPGRKQMGVLLWYIAMNSTGKIEEEKQNRPQPILESYARREVRDELFPQQRFQLRLQNLGNHAGTLPWGLLGSLFTSKSAERWHSKDPTVLPQLAGRESSLRKARMLQPSLPALSEFTDWNAMRIHGWLCHGSLGLSRGPASHVAYAGFRTSAQVQALMFSCLSLSFPFLPKPEFYHMAKKIAHSKLKWEWDPTYTDNMSI